MRKLFGASILVAALLLSACGAAQVQTGADQAASAISAPEVNTTVSDALNQAATAMADPAVASAMSEAQNQAATAMADPAVASAMSAAATEVAGALGSLSAAASNITLQQGQQLVLDASQSVGDIKDYKWTITKAPAGAESVVGQTIKEGSSGNVSLSPDDYTKYFPKSGSYTVQLTVTDGTGATSSSDFTIDVP